MIDVSDARVALEQNVFIELARPKTVDRLVDPSVSVSQSEKLKQELLGYLKDFAAALGLPVHFRLEIRQAEEDATVLTRAVLRVCLGDRACRIPTHHTLESPHTLARFIASTVVENREALLNEQLVDHLRPGTSPSSAEAPDKLDPVRFPERVRQLVRRGHGLSKLDGILERSRQSAAAVKSSGSFEEVLSAPDIVGLELALGSHQVEAICSADKGKVRQWLEHSTTKSSPVPGTILEPRLDALRRRLFDELGVILPKIKVCSEAKLTKNEFQVRLNDLLLPPEDGLPWDDLAVWDPSDFVARRMELTIRDRAEMFLTTYCIDELRASSTGLVEAVSQRIGMPMLLHVLECLLEEGLSIRDLRGICESLLAVDSSMAVDQDRFIVFFPPISNICPVREKKPVETLDSLDYLNCVRMSMKPYFSHKYARKGTLFVYLLDPQMEERLGRTDADPLTEEERNQLLSAVGQQIANPASPSAAAAILTSMPVRRKLWTLIEREFRRFPVLTYSELSPDLNVQPISRITWD
jgi:hypothetical protein